MIRHLVTLLANIFLPKTFPEPDQRPLIQEKLKRHGMDPEAEGFRLCKNGGGLIGPNAIVFGNAYIAPNARVLGDGMVSSKGKVLDRAVVGPGGKVCAGDKIEGNRVLVNEWTCKRPRFV